MFIGYALLAVSMLLYFVTVGVILPRKFLQPQYVGVRTDARGLRRCLFNGKRCVVYERCVNQRRYIKRYLLCQGEGCKLFKCQVAPDVQEMKYDVVLFNCHNEIFDVIRVDEVFATQCSKILTLPDETAYVSLRIRQANKKKITVQPMTKLPPRGFALFALCTVLLSLVQCVITMVGCAFAFGGVYREDFAGSPRHLLVGSIIAAASILVGLVMIFISTRRRMKV